MSVSFAVGCVHGRRLLQGEAEGNRPGPQPWNASFRASRRQGFPYSGQCLA